MDELPSLTEEGKLLDESSSDLSCQTVLCESTTNTVHKVEYLVVEKEDSKYNTVATLVMGSCFSLGVNCQFKTRQDTLCLVKCWICCIIWWNRSFWFYSSQAGSAGPLLHCALQCSTNHWSQLPELSKAFPSFLFCAIQR